MQNITQLLFANDKGKIYSFPELRATGMKGGHYFCLSAKDLIKLPKQSELFVLPGRLPVGFDVSSGSFCALEQDPYSKRNKKPLAVCAFIPPGFTTTYSSSYVKFAKPSTLPLFSYAAACFYKGEFYAATTRVDRELRQDLRFMDIELVEEGVNRLRKLFIKNRLVRHLESCALCYGCPAAKNFFLSRYEAPLPTSPSCNASCAGCISYQPDKRCPIAQPRIRFIPTPEEIAEVAVFHIKNVKDPVVSFGQGCEGEPLLVSDTIQRAIRLIRSATAKGMINLNTNASSPTQIVRLIDAGLDSIRVSSNSFQEIFYRRYYRPRGYMFRDVVKSIETAKKKGAFVSINYLMLPGFSDSPNEFNALVDLIGKHKVDMLQLRNLNFDPLNYFKVLGFNPDVSNPIGIREVIGRLKNKFPKLMLGYFNPSKERIKRNVRQVLSAKNA